MGLIARSSLYCFSKHVTTFLCSGCNPQLLVPRPLTHDPGTERGDSTLEFQNGLVFTLISYLKWAERDELRGVR